MHGDERSYEVQILRAIDYGNLPQEEIERRLRNLIGAEIGKVDASADLQIIEACQALLLEMHGHSEQLTVSAEKPKEAEKVIAQMVQHRRLFLRPIIRTVSIATFLIVGLAFAGIFLRSQWIQGYSTPDGQQYVIESHVVEPSIISAALAERHEISNVQVDSLNALVDFLGFDPGIPEMILETWKSSFYYAFFLPDRVQVITYYDLLEVPEASLAYNIYYFADKEDARFIFEQSQEGESQRIGEIDVYVSKNVDRTTAWWMYNNAVYRIAGDFSFDEAKSLIYDLFQRR